MTLIQKLFGFHGRLRRRDWWLWGIALAIANLAVQGLVGTMLFPGHPPVMMAVIGDPPALLLTSVAMTALVQWPVLALVAKRAHDRNWSAWPFMAIQLTGVALSYVPSNPFAALEGSATTPPNLLWTV